MVNTPSSPPGLEPWLPAASGVSLPPEAPQPASRETAIMADRVMDKTFLLMFM